MKRKDNKELIDTLLIGYAIGKHMYKRIFTIGATAAPIANPYREQIDCGIICRWTGKKNCNFSYQFVNYHVKKERNGAVEMKCNF